MVQTLTKQITANCSTVGFPVFPSFSDRKTAGLLTWWELLEARQMLCHERLRRNEHKGVLDEPPT